MMNIYIYLSYLKNIYSKNACISQLSLFVLLFSMITSCISEKELLNKVNYQSKSIDDRINNSFKNADSLNPNNCTLAELLYGFHKIRFYDKSLDTLKSGYTTLKYDGNKKLDVHFLAADSSLVSFTLKVQKKGNYLALRRKTFIIPIPFLCFVHKERDGILYINDSGQLNIVQGETQTIWILMAGGFSFTNNFTFNPCESKQE